MSDASISENNTPRKTFSDSWYQLALMVAFIILGRIYLLEPFKIPSGSMEPTLIGHEDFGDRILTNKLAYVPFMQALLVGGAFLVLILQGLSWAVDYARFGEIRDIKPFFISLFLVAVTVFKSFRTTFYSPSFDWIALALFAYVALQTVYWYACNFGGLKENKAALRWAAIALFLVLGGMGYAWTQNAVASEPRRFDVPVFEFSQDWTKEGDKDINYIKRLTGLPGDRIMVSCGDLFLWNKKKEKFEIIRKWQERGDALQDALWFPVSKAFSPQFSIPESFMPPPDQTTPPTPEQLEIQKQRAIIEKQLRDLRFPWSLNGAEDGVPGAKLEDKALALDGSASVDLKYKFPVTNVYLKQGRWPFTHIGCPAAHMAPLKSPSGISWCNPNSKPEQMEAVVSNTWEGIQCPNCRQILFPIVRGYNDGTTDGSKGGTQLRANGGTNFFYGGHYTVGDLKIDLKIQIESAGSLHLEVGNTLRRAVWNIPGGGEEDKIDALGKGKDGHQHFVHTKTNSLTPGEHTVTLAYVDGTVIAALDGSEIERRLLDVEPLPLPLYKESETIARVKLDGIKGRITMLNLSRDLFYTTTLQHGDGSNGGDHAYYNRDDDSSSESSFKGPMTPRASQHAHYEKDTDNLIIDVQPGEYLMMGDNSPSSSDSRVWGGVPRERIMGRAWVVGWPLSRWKIIR